jgi:hypothetical protein
LSNQLDGSLDQYSKVAPACNHVTANFYANFISTIFLILYLLQ